ASPIGVPDGGGAAAGAGAGDCAVDAAVVGGNVVVVVFGAVAAVAGPPEATGGAGRLVRPAERIRPTTAAIAEVPVTAAAATPIAAPRCKNTRRSSSAAAAP